MGNLVCGAAMTSFCKWMIHDAQGRLSRITAKRAKLAMQIARAGDGQNKAAEVADKNLEHKQQVIELYLKLLQSMLEAHQKLLDKACEEVAPKLNVSN